MRATIDLDDPTEAEVIAAWNRLDQHNDRPVHGRVSSSGTGVHLKIHGCDEQDVPRLRRECGDDRKRIGFDNQTTLKPKQILFSEKPAADGAGEWTTDREEVLAEYRDRCPFPIRRDRHPAFPDRF